MNNIRLSGICEGKGPRLPNGQQVGSYSVEDGRVVWIRNVCLERHLLRIRDAWTINEPILDQLRIDSVDAVRYVSEAGIYEVELSEFIERSVVLEGFACGENSHVLPRTEWTTHSSSSTEFLPLFVVDDG